MTTIQASELKYVVFLVAVLCPCRLDLLFTSCRYTALVFTSSYTITGTENQQLNT